VFDFQQIQGAGLAGVLGLPGLGALGGLGASSDPGGAGGSGAPAPQTTVTMGTLPVTGAKQKAYVVRTRINDGLWADLWVSQQGDILLARTSLGVTMLSNLYEYDTLERPTTRRGSDQ
jgi:hypothetical protein